MFDLRQNVIEAFDQCVSSGKVESMISTQIEKTIGSILENQLRHYSDFGKQIEEAVKKSLAIHGELDLPCYNQTILNIIGRQIEAQTRDSIEKQVAERMKELLTPAPESITLSKLVETFIEDTREQADAGCVCHGDEQHRIYFEVENDSSHGLFRKISLGREYGQGTKKDADMSIGIHLRRRRDDAEPIVGTVYHLWYRDNDVEKQLFVGPLRGFERFLFQMKAAGTALVFDVDPADIETTYEPEHSY